MAAPSGKAPSKMRGVLLNWGPSLVFNVLLPILTYNYLRGHGHTEVISILGSSVWTVFELSLYFVLHRRLDEFGIAMLAFFGLGLLSATAFNSARLLLVKESVISGFFGIMLLASLLFPKPLMFFFGRKFATDGTV